MGCLKNYSASNRTKEQSTKAQLHYPGISWIVDDWVVVLVSAPLVRVPLHMLERPVSGCRPSSLKLAIVDDKQQLTN